MYPLLIGANGDNQTISLKSIQLINDHRIKQHLWQEKAQQEYWECYLKKLKNMSYAEAKQLLYIQCCFTNKPISFNYSNYNDILLELTSELNKYPSPQQHFALLQQYRIQWLLPMDLHDWIKDDLSAMLYYTANLDNDLFFEGSFYGRDEFSKAFMDFIQLSYFNINPQNQRLELIKINFSEGYDKILAIKDFSAFRHQYLTNRLKPSKLKWLNDCPDEMLDKLLEDLDEDGSLILKGVFLPKTRNDKLCLIQASLNNLPIEDLYLFKKIDDITTSICLLEGSYRVYINNGFISFEDDQINFNRDLYHNPFFYNEKFLQWHQRHTYLYYGNVERNLTFNGKTIPELFKQNRQHYIDKYKNRVAVGKNRESRKRTLEDRTVEILQKNMPYLEEMAKVNRMSIKLLVNQWVEIEYKKFKSGFDDQKKADL
jgi:hypothetical protein